MVFLPNFLFFFDSNSSCSKSSVQWCAPTGDSLHAVAIINASSLSSVFRGCPGLGLSIIAPCIPFAVNRLYNRPTVLADISIWLTMYSILLLLFRSNNTLALLISRDLCVPFL